MPKGAPVTVRLDECRTTGNMLALHKDVGGLGLFLIVYSLEKGSGALRIRCQFTSTASTTVRIGIFFLGFDFPPDCRSTRLLSGCYCGSSMKNHSLLWRFEYDDRKGLSQMAPAIDQKLAMYPTTRTSHQYLALSFPPSYADGVAEAPPGASVNGAFIVEVRGENIWDPFLKKRELARLSDANAVSTPRFSYREYLANWERYIRDPDLWVPLGDDMGMFHVGFYGMLSEWKNGGPFGYSLDGKPFSPKNLHDLVYGSRRIGGAALGCRQENAIQCEIAWGNGGNSMVAYALFNYGTAWSVNFARRIINAILGLRGRGFLIPDGPLRNAWIGAYEARSGRFQDHYGFQQVFIPDQGFVNYFLARCQLEGHVKDPRIVEAIRRNCDEFLLPLEKRFGHLPNALWEDGTAGYSREGYRYDRPNAPGIAMSALSFIVLHKLTGDRKHLQTAERFLIENLKPLIDASEFGFLEYDHNGHDSAGACMILIALAEYLELQGVGCCAQEARRLQDAVFHYLLSFRHEHDYFLYKHSKNTVGWGGIPINKHGFMHGFTKGSTQGTYCEHTRWDYPYALLRTAQTSRRAAIARMAAINHLNYLTYQQFVNPTLPKGYGGITEHTAHSTYVQDTTHLIHSTPLAMIMMGGRQEIPCSVKVGRHMN
jgi:hypothetical protein